MDNVIILYIDYVYMYIPGDGSFFPKKKYVLILWSYHFKKVIILTFLGINLKYDSRANYLYTNLYYRFSCKQK